MKFLSLTAFAVLVLGCSAPKQTVSSTPDPTTGNAKPIPGKMKDNFDKEGHRGCRGLMPENTIPAMLKALELGVTTLEMDVSFTRDMKAILSHEPFFNHEITTKPDGSFVTEAEERNLNIYRMDYAEVLKYDIGMKPHPRFPRQQKMPAVKPLLADVIDSAEAYASEHHLAKPHYNIETKSEAFTDNVYHPGPEVFVDAMMAVILSRKISDRVIIQSFDVRTLQYMHQKFPGVKTALLIEDFDKKGIELQLQVLGFTPTIYSPDYKLVNQELVEKCHAKNMLLVPYTVNDVKKINELKAMGVDGVITDYPDLFEKL